MTDKKDRFVPVMVWEKTRTAIREVAKKRDTSIAKLMDQLAQSARKRSFPERVV